MLSPRPLWQQSASKPLKVEIMAREEGGMEEQGRQGDVDDDDEEDDEDADDGIEVRASQAWTAWLDVNHPHTGPRVQLLLPEALCQLC